MTTDRRPVVGRQAWQIRSAPRGSVSAVPDDSRGQGRRDQDAPTPRPPEPLRDQVFAACGYALAIAALATGLLAPHLGRLGLPCGLALAAALAPVNVLAIRHFARPRHTPTARNTAAHRSDGLQPSGEGATPHEPLTKP